MGRLRPQYQSSTMYGIMLRGVTSINLGGRGQSKGVWHQPTCWGGTNDLHVKVQLSYRQEGCVFTESEQSVGVYSRVV